MLWINPYRFGARPPDLAWESDSGVTGSPASSWASLTASTILAQGTAANQPAVTPNAFGTTQGLTFDGTSDWMAIAAKPVTATAAGSLSIVFKTGSVITAGVLLAQADSAVTNNWWEIGINANGKVYIESNDAGAKRTVVCPTVLISGTVYDIIVAWDGTDFYVLLKGIEENPLIMENSASPMSWLGRVNGTTVFSIGACMPSGGAVRFFNGVLGGIYFWSMDITG